MTAVDGLMKISGSAGSDLFCSAACVLVVQSDAHDLRGLDRRQQPVPFRIELFARLELAEDVPFDEAPLAGFLDRVTRTPGDSNL